MNMDRDPKWDRWSERWERRWDRRWERWSNQSGRSTASGVVIGAAIVAAGSALLLDNLGIIHFEDIWKFWPVILIIWGISRLLEGTSPVHWVWGGLITLVGALFLLDNLDLIPFRIDFGALIIPMVIIGFGISLLLRNFDWKRPGDQGAAPASTKSDVGMAAIFSGRKSRIESPDFKGGEIIAVFGGVKLDMRHAGIAGDRAVIGVNDMFGGVDIRVPENWNVVMKGVGIFGAFEDKTVHTKPDPNVRNPELVITGVGIFAGVKVDN